MRHLLWVWATLAVGVPASFVHGEDSTAAPKLDGVWLPESAELAGQKLQDELLKTMKLKLADGKYSVTVAGQTDAGTVKLDPKAKPKTMDITGTDGPNKGKTFLAIYELGGDTLRICYDLSGKNRPTEFRSDKESQLFLVTYRREKP